VSTALEANVLAVLVRQLILDTEISMAMVWTFNMDVRLFRSVCA
jgi:hypothetical protein